MQMYIKVGKEEKLLKKKHSCTAYPFNLVPSEKEKQYEMRCSDVHDIELNKTFKFSSMDHQIIA